MLENSQEKANATIQYEINVPTAFDAQVYFHAMVLMRREFGKKKVNIHRSAANSMTAGMAFLLVQKACDAFKKSCSLGPLQVFSEPCMWSSTAVIQFQVLSQRSDGFVSLKEQKTLYKSGPPLLGPDRAHATAKNGSPEADEAIRFLCYSMGKNVSELISNNLLYRLRDRWTELDKFRFQRGQLPLVLSTLPDSVGKALNMMRLRPP